MGRVTYVRQRDRAAMMNKQPAQPMQSAPVKTTVETVPQPSSDIVLKRQHLYIFFFTALVAVSGYLAWKVCKKQ